MRGVAQGSPLSSMLFNLAIDFTLCELGEERVASEFGFSLSHDLPAVSEAGFADNVLALCKDAASCDRLIEMLANAFSRIGLAMNLSKSAVVIISIGKLIAEDIILLDGTRIHAISQDERIRYLGVTFKDEIVSNKETFLKNLGSDLKNL